MRHRHFRTSPWGAILLSCMVACSSNQTLPPPTPALSATATAGPLSPCEVAKTERARIPGLESEGRLDRILRVIRHADELCPAGIQEGLAPRMSALEELGREKEAQELATEIAADRQAPDEARALATRVLDPSRKPIDPRSADELFEAGLSAKLKGNRAEMQRLFDRAIVAGERESGKSLMLEPPFGEDHEPARARLSADGKILASAAGHGVSIRDSRARFREVRRLEGPSADVTDVVLLADGKRIAAGAKDFSLWIWDYGTGKALAHFVHRSELGSAVSPLKDELDSIASSPDGALLASATTTGASGGTVRLWDLAKGVELRKLEGFRDGTSPIAFSADGKTISTESQSEGVKRWDVGTGRLLPWKDIAPPAASSELSGSSRDLEAWKKTRPRSDVSPNTILAVSPDGKKIATGSQDHNVRLWSVDGRAQMRAAMHDLGVHRQTVAGLAFAPDSRSLASCGGDGVFLWGTLSNQKMRSLDVPSGCGSLAFSPDGKRLGVATGPGVRVLNLETGLVESTLDVPPRSFVHMVGFSPEGSTIAASFTGGVRIWDSASGALKHELPGGDFAFTGDGLRLAVAAPRAVFLLDLSTGREVQRFEKAESGFVPVAISPDGSRLAMATTGGPVELWQLPSGAERDLPGDSAAGGVTFLRDGRTLVTSDTALRFWTASGQPILSVVAISKAGASYALLAGSTPFVELMGIDLDSASDAFVCRLGASSFPFELCRERFEVHGILAKALAGEAIAIDP